MAENPRFEEVAPDDDQTRIIQNDPLSEPARPIPPAGKMPKAPPQEFADRPNALPDPAPAPKAAPAKIKPSSKLKLTKKRSGSDSKPAPKPKPASTAKPAASGPKPEPVSFDLPKEPPVSQRQPAYKSSFEDDEQGSDGGGLGTALGIGAIFLSLAALLLSLGVINVGGQEEITSGQIAPGAVGKEQIYDGSVTADKLEPQLITDLKGQTGPTGARGPRGQQGKRGAVGAAGITGLNTVERTVNGTAASEVSTIASCGSGEIAIGGGGTVAGASGAVAVTSSEPTPDFSGWQAAAAQVGDTKASWSLSVYAICALPSRELRKDIEG